MAEVYQAEIYVVNFRTDASRALASGALALYNYLMKQNAVERFALTVTRGIGSPTSIIIHTLIFIASFWAAYSGYIAWPTMLLVLTTIVSLEAIYLSIFIQMTINY